MRLGTNDIKEAIVSILNGAGYRVYDEHVRDPDFSKGPLIFVEVSPAAWAFGGAGIYETRRYIIDCGYVAGEVPTRREMYEALDAMQDLLTPAIPIGDRSPTVDGVNYSIVDGVAHCILEIELTQKRIDRETEDYMETLDVSMTT